MKIEFFAIKNPLITNFFSLSMNQLKIDAKVIDALNEQLGSIANALRMATTAQEIKDDTGMTQPSDEEHVGEANQIRPANANKVIVQCADAEEVVLNSNLFNSAELIKFISENYSNITIKLDKQGSDAFKKIVIDDALRSNPYAAPIELKAERWTDNLAKSCIVKVLYSDWKVGYPYIIFQLIPKVSVCLAHMLIFKLTGTRHQSTTLFAISNVISANDNMPGFIHRGDISCGSLEETDDLSMKILTMVCGYYSPFVINSIIKREMVYKKSFKFFGWYANYARSVDIIILFEHEDKPSASYAQTTKYVLFKIKPRYEVPYDNRLQYYFSWSRGSTGDHFGAFGAVSTCDLNLRPCEKLNNKFKFSNDSMDMIRQFIAIFEFELICDAKRVEWDWNCRIHNCY